MSGGRRGGQREEVALGRVTEGSGDKLAAIWGQGLTDRGKGSIRRGCSRDTEGSVAVWTRVTPAGRVGRARIRNLFQGTQEP